MAEKNPKAEIRKLADKFNCSKMQISTILHNKERIIILYEANMSGDCIAERESGLPSPQM